MSADAQTIGPSSVTPWLTKREAAARARLSLATLQNAMRSGELRYSGGGKRGGGRVVIHVEWLDAWLEGRVEERDPECP